MSGYSDCRHSQSFGCHPRHFQHRAQTSVQRLAAVAEWYRYRIVACLATSSSPVPLKTHRVGQRCTLNLSRAETSSRWCGVAVRRGGTTSVGKSSHNGLYDSLRWKAVDRLEANQSQADVARWLQVVQNMSRGHVVYSKQVVLSPGKSDKGTTEHRHLHRIST
ncbi:uncharacterized protein TNCV_1573961 [Trichonephila clavipes]|nr:uncharacterized protein TNCV_1573961 [Trichonephila clavipes]